MIQIRRWVSLAALGVFAGLLAGCGSSDSKPVEEKTSQTPAEGKKTAAVQLPVTSIGGVSGKDVSQEQESTALSLLGEIRNLQRQPLESRPLKEGEQRDRKQFAKLLKQRNEKIVKLASRAVLLAHKNKAGDEVLHQAVKRLSEARLQLALQGDHDQADLLYADADVLRQKVPGSKAAMEAAYAVVRFVNTNAKLHSQKNQDWVTELARQARTFAEEFPDEQAKTIPLLLAAGESCERYNLIEEARLCFVQIYDQYPKTSQAVQAKGIERRLGLEGQVLKFGGATYAGEHFSIRQTRGKTTVIVFWSSNIRGIQETLKQIDKIAGQYEKSQLEIVGVCLDEDELMLEQTLGESGLTWKQLFDPSQEKRRWDHPVVKYYGVRKVPSLWVVDPQGVVVSTRTTLKALPDVLSAQVSHKKSQIR